MRVLIGLGIPLLGILIALPWVASIDRYVLGVPFVYAWSYAWFVLTSGCLALCWLLFDRNKVEADNLED
ncbi:hypothetical protein BLA39750_00877 [Burkholderia lata]|uniref:DUF3311 domain-containing protein n=2 Tax=Burkholderia lata (strain ATCC 17760 / DSM 23089 / LMG 22485 / NCIMB 9086 / R18194 / 383) TaxID=482957 RepID=A0A6P2ULX1_BURL3|nr:hypothetical protein BLA39750_00877 [Burkholderia lata]